MTLDNDVLRRSVTAGDYSKDPHGGVNLFQFVYPGAYSGYTALSPWWSRDRDFQLRQTVHLEAMWSSAIFKAITKRAALGFEIKDETESAIRVKRAQELFLLADLGRGWVYFLQRHLRDFLLTDNGAFVEIIRTSSARGGRILGLAHLDSCRCTRTQDPSRPVLYRDRQGREHILKDHQVLMFADMPDAGDTYNGVGFCAASRAYPTIVKMAALEQYYYEKYSGDGALGISFVSGVSPKSLESALTTADEEHKRRGLVHYKNKMVIPTMSDKPPAVAEVALKSTPENFDVEQERSNAYLIYANAIGIGVADVQPLSGQGLGTGTQSVILDDAAEGMGLAAWNKQWEQTSNEHILPTATTFLFVNTHDLRDQKAKAEVAKLRAEERDIRLNNGELAIEEARQRALDAGDLDRELQPNDKTSGTLSDVEKPVEEEETTEEPEEIVEEVEDEVVEQKASRDSLDMLISREWKAAYRLARELVAQ